MKISKHFLMLQRIHSLIRRSGTGTPEELAAKVGKSRATVYRYIEELKDLGAPIIYCRKRKSFIYEKDFDMKW